MSVQLYSASQPGPEETDATLSRTTVGANKPLHRFIKGQPKIVGIVILILGTAFFMISIALLGDSLHLSMYIILPPGFLQGSLFIVCGILYILTEHNPTKKTVTTSLALSVATALAAIWSFLLIVSDVGYGHSSHTYREYNSTEYEEPLTSHYGAMEIVLGIILAFYTLAGVIIVIVMSTLATAALRSTKCQAVVVMTTDPTSLPTQ